MANGFNKDFNKDVNMNESGL